MEFTNGNKAKINEALVKESLKNAKLNEVGSERMLKFFKYDHLPEKMQAVSKPFCELAEKMVIELMRSPERSCALRKLLEAKDCAVRCML